MANRINAYQAPFSRIKRKSHVIVFLFLKWCQFTSEVSLKVEDGKVQRVDDNQRVGELTKEIVTADLPSTEVSSPSLLRPLGNHSSEVLSNSQQEKDTSLGHDYMESMEGHRKEQRVNVATHGVGQRFSRQPASLGRRDELQSCSGTSTDEIEESFVDAFGNLSIQCAYTAQQECRSHLGDSGDGGPIEFHSRKGNVNNESFLGK